MSKIKYVHTIISCSFVCFISKKFDLRFLSSYISMIFKMTKNCLRIQFKGDLQNSLDLWVQKNGSEVRNSFFLTWVSLFSPDSEYEVSFFSNSKARCHKMYKSIMERTEQPINTFDCKYNKKKFTSYNIMIFTRDKILWNDWHQDKHQQLLSYSW